MCHSSAHILFKSASLVEDRLPTTKNIGTALTERVRKLSRSDFFLGGIAVTLTTCVPKFINLDRLLEKLVTEKVRVSEIHVLASFVNKP